MLDTKLDLWGAMFYLPPDEVLSGNKTTLAQLRRRVAEDPSPLDQPGAISLTGVRFGSDVAYGQERPLKSSSAWTEGIRRELRVYNSALLFDAKAMTPIQTVAAVIANDRGDVLLVRKRGSSIFIQPGGKTEAGEDPLVALARELDEELGVSLDPASIGFLGEFEDVAVNEPGRRVKARAYRCRIHGTPAPRAEIETTCWVPASGPYPVAVAPLSAAGILPAFAAWRSCDATAIDGEPGSRTP